MPLPRRYQGRIWRFVSNPDENINLKLILENIKNYGVAASIVIAGVYLFKTTDGILSTLSSMTLALFGTTLIGLNVMQSYLLFVRWFYARSNTEAGDSESRWNAKLNLLVLVTLSITVVLAGIFFAASILKRAG